MSTSRIARALLGVVAGAALLGIAGAVPASADPAPASVTVCTYKVTKVQALELQEDGGLDEIYLILDGQRFPSSGSVPIRRTQTRFASTLGNPTVQSAGPVTVQLWEDDPIFDDLLGEFTLPCQADTDTKLIERPGDYEYLVSYEVTTREVLLA